MESTEARVLRVIKELLGVAEIRAQDKLEDLGADSLDRIEITMAIEVEFKMEIADEMIERIVTVQDAIQLVKEMRNEL